MNLWIPLLAALIGALIGAAGSIAVIVIQARASERRQRLELVTKLALEHYRHKMELAAKTGESVPSFVVYLHYHLGLLKLLEQGDLHPDDVAELEHENTVLALQVSDSEDREAVGVGRKTAEP